MNDLDSTPMQVGPQHQRLALKRIGLGLSIVLFGVPALLLWVTTRTLIPALVETGWEPLLAWFFTGGLLCALLLMSAIAGAILAEARSLPDILRELRVRPLSSAEWRLTGLTLLATILAIAALHAINAGVWPRLPAYPPFISVTPLAPVQSYILAIWLPFFVLNVIGEELWWRGFIQPRQEPVFGASTWIVQGLLHGLFHVSFGTGLLFVLIPVLFTIPWAVQRTRNTTAGIVIHAGVNGPGFLAVSLGLLPS